MDIRRASELSLCSLLKEALPDIPFYPSRGGGDDITPVWQANHFYKLGDVLRSPNLTLKHAIVVTVAGNSGGGDAPPFNDAVGSIVIASGVTYQTIVDLAVFKAVDSSSPIPPFAVVSIDGAEKTISQEGTSYLKGVLIWVTRADATNIVTHTGTFKRIYDALSQIGRGYDIMRRITIHGVDIGSTDEFTDEARKSHGEKISFSMGVTEKLAQAG